MEFKPLAGLTSSLTTLFKINIVTNSIAVLTDTFAFGTYTAMATGFNQNQVLLPSAFAIAFMKLTQFVLSIVMYIILLCWIYRTNKNLRGLSGEQMAFTPGWSVGWFFVPIANLFKPYQAMNEIWTVSHRNESTNPDILGWWWVLYIVYNVVVYVQYIFNTRAVTSENNYSSAVLEIAIDGIEVAFCFAALILVTRIASAYSKNIIEPIVNQRKLTN